MSLGVDLVTHKVCSLDCLYCECGKTTELTLERKEYVPFDGVVRELEDYFTNHPDPDYITFSGSGEPCLHSRIGEVIDFIKDKKPGVRVAVLTNGTLLGLSDVRKELLKADLVVPSLDGATMSAFQMINRPHGDISLDDYLAGLQSFRSVYTGKLALELFILPGVNDTLADLVALKQAVDRIRPDVVQLNSLDRPGTESDIRGASTKELRRVAQALGWTNVEIIAAVPQTRKADSFRKDRESAVLETLYRRPCTPDDLKKILGLSLTEVDACLADLKEAGKIDAVLEKRGLFYSVRDKDRGLKKKDDRP